MKLNLFNSILVVFFTLCVAQGQNIVTTNQLAVPVTNKSPSPTNPPADNVSANRANDSTQTNKTIVVKLDETTLASLSPRPEPWWKNLIPLISALLGAIIGYVGSYKATMRSHKLQVSRQKEQDAEFVRRLEACLAAELDMLGQFYGNGIGKDLSASPIPQPLRVHFLLTEKWFTVFEANANHLGKFEEHKSASIIKIYGLMKSMVEYFRINNWLLDQLEAVEKHLAQVVDHPDARTRRSQLVNQMTQLATLLKDLENKLKQELERFNNFRTDRS